MPNRSHIPRDLSVFLGERKLRLRFDLAHKSAHIDALVHAVDRSIVHPLHRIDDACDFVLDAFSPLNDLMTREQ